MKKKTFLCPHCDKYISIIILPEENKLSNMCSKCSRSSPGKMYCKAGILQVYNKRVCTYFEEKKGRDNGKKVKK